VLLNVRVREKREIATLPLVHQAIRAAESALERRGRVVVRYSGTEALARVMIEGENTDRITRLAEDIVSAFQSEIGVE
jgi:phosphoglucosamine mutase